VTGDEVKRVDGAYKTGWNHRANHGAKNSRALRTANKYMTEEQNYSYRYIFFNFTNKDFTGYWNGKPYTFKPGVKKYYPKGIAEHFAKHLTNQILTETGKEVYTSPKKPSEVPAFMEIFNKALLVEKTPDSDNLEIEGHDGLEEPSMNVRTQKRQEEDLYDAHSQPAVGPGSAPQVIGEEVAEDDNEGYEEAQN
jgi:hypothetical protein